MARALPSGAWPPRSTVTPRAAPTSLWLEALRRFRKHRLAMIGRGGAR